MFRLSAFQTERQNQTLLQLETIWNVINPELDRNQIGSFPEDELEYRENSTLKAILTLWANQESNSDAENKFIILRNQKPALSKAINWYLHRKWST